ncbi:Gluconate transporter family protein [Pseudonocardia sp. Ae406_Ps2]|uniref:GntP family permease n=1 Tax=unclassified Pseudonocardia TaxID=2619320 RepID=UPI00094B1C16|nr:MULTISPECIES: gluconate:H+ symporter [unclassified Pseudonocardia]OLL97326.1 Gluconate transporter family protein [Pseudonocardia sp. Ae331_Ps2]OLM04962.1 Gluconate transporter family protein [Pseudonocardia sp. Ae406_Ps2]OLM10208.1 Gluconate transporter family protein [Pseudonocardia sp. Ae505_Ps2]OLM26534.1 Gluconate transporter family protein [Pseudonocardia sp. Ae706_Ps2]OLM33387.1 Gluconate transporter family protein [Pseudonocardia sp. Ae717_Ps2]
MNWSGWYLVLVLVAAIVVLIVLINSRVRFSPFVALLVVALGVGLAGGEDLATIADSITTGAGDILGDVGLTLALGTMLGRLLAESGATGRIADAVVSRSTPRSLPWLVCAAAFVIGVPMFFEVGLIVLLPLLFSVARRLELEGAAPSPYATVAIPAIATLATLHGMVPPHPGPLIAVDGLGADLGRTIVVGLLCAVPAIVVGGPLYARLMAPRLPVRPDAELVAQFTETGTETGTGAGGGVGPDGRRGEEPAPVPLPIALVAVAVPVVLMLARTVAEVALPDGAVFRQVTTLLGQPIVAMLAGFLYALFALGLLRGRPAEELRTSLADAVKSVTGILLIIGGGGAFNQVLKDSGISDAVGAAASGLPVSPLLLAWLLALLLSTSTGSATVGIVAATGVVAPLLAGAGPWYVALAVVAVGAGSVGLNYVNHAGFWLVKESFGMTVGQATRSHTAVQTVVSVVGLVMVLLLSLVLPAGA